MSHRLRHIAKLLVVAGFMAACTGMNRAIHLHAAVERHTCQDTTCRHEGQPPAPEHAPGQCLVCHELTVGTLAVVDWTPGELSSIEVVTFADPPPVRVPDLLKHHEPFAPRGPPHAGETCC
jgi:hypothetical protein